MIVKHVAGTGTSTGGRVEPVIGERIGGGVVVLVVKRCREGKIRLGFRSPEVSGGGVIRTRRVLCGVERSEPHPGFLHRVSDLGGEPAPWSLSDAPVSRLLEKNRPRTGSVELDRAGAGGGSTLTHLQRPNLF